MATSKITEKDVASSVKSDAHFLVTQSESVGGAEAEALRRATLPQVVAALRQNGVNSGVVETIQLPDLAEIDQDDEAMEYYGKGSVNVSTGVFAASQTNYDTFLYVFPEDADFYITRDSGNALIIALYNQTLETLPTTSAQADSLFTDGARYTSASGENTLPTSEDMWHADAGWTLAITRINSTYVSDFTLYRTQAATRLDGEVILAEKHIAQVVESNEVVSMKEDVTGLQTDVYGARVGATATGAVVPLTGRMPDEISFTGAGLTAARSANRFNIAAVNFSRSSSSSNPTVTKTDTGVIIESDPADNSAGSNRYLYFTYTAEATGRLWVSCRAEAATHETRDCRMLVRINGVQKTPHLVGEGEQKRSYAVTAGDSVQVWLYYHLYTSTAVNTVTYSDIMIAYDDLDTYVPYAADAAAKRRYGQGDLLVFDGTADVSYTKLSDAKKRKCVCFGDSITGMFDAGDDYPSMVAKLADVECVNAGFSGSRWTNHSNQNYRPFSVNQLIDAVVSGDFSAQDAAVGSVTSEFYSEHLAALEAVDFNAVDCVTFLAGTNDWGFNVPATSESDPSTEDKQQTNIEDAVKYSVRKLLDAYPHLSILILTPYWRNINNDEDSDVTPNESGVYLYEVAEVIARCARECNVASEDLYHSLGASMKTRYYWTIDGTHPTVRTRRAIAARIADWIRKSGV